MTPPPDFEFPEYPLDSMAFMLDGKCAGMPTKLFFPESGKRVSPRARAACEDCEVHDQCLAWALEFEEYGFWASTTAEERKEMRKSALCA